MQLPKGFRAVSFYGLLRHFAVSMPTLGPLLFEHLRISEDETRARIAALEQQRLVQFAIGPKEDPAVFIAPDGQYASRVDQLFAQAIVDFWEVAGTFDAVKGEIIEQHPGGSRDQVLAKGSASAFAVQMSTGSRETSAMTYRVETPDGDLVVDSQVAYKLRDLQLLTQDDEGHFHGPSKAQVIQWVDEHGVCDFCNDPTPRHVELVPDFEMPVPPGVSLPSVPRSLGGWATCDTCHALVVENRRAELLQRAIQSSAGGKFTAAALRGLHRSFWEAMDQKIDAAGIGAAVLDFIDGKIPAVGPHAKLSAREVRQEAIRRLTGLTMDEMEALGKGDVLYRDVAKKLSSWRKRFGIGNGAQADARKIAQMLHAAEQPPLPPNVLPHWQVALDRKVDAITRLKVVETLDPDEKDRLRFFDFQQDLAALRAAEVYSFSEETMHAIRLGAESIPHESSLQSIEIPPVHAGWFWFATPFPVASALEASDTTAALLWSWDLKCTTPTLRFSAFCVDEKNAMTRGQMVPSTQWMWPVDLSYHQMIGFSRQLYRRAYGETGPFTDAQFLQGEEGTLKTVAEMSIFFLMACLWFRQTVPGSKKKIDPQLTQTPGHIERHARKRYEKEFKVPPVVRVIALRKSAVVPVTDPQPTGASRHLTVRFVVDGHARLQPYGPGKQFRKLIWIMPYPKGPEGAPFKAAPTKVFAVVR